MLERDNPLIDATVSWLLEPDPLNPGVRYHALQHLLDRPEDDDEVIKAQEQIMQTGPVPTILAAQHPDGYWARPGGGHAPSYTVTMWQIIFLAELGADPNDERVQRGCSYFLDHIVAANGGFSMNPKPTPSSVVHCLNGDPLHALMELGFSNDARVQSAIDWQVNAITGEGDIRFYKSGTSDKNFTCAYNQKQPCAWGAVKALKAFSTIPPDHHAPEIRRSIEIGASFLLDQDLSKADYPFTERINSSWFSFSFPLSFRSDILETALTLTSLGYGQDARLENALQFILNKRDKNGSWIMEKSLNGKMWADIEQKGKPSKWITLRALLSLGIQGLD